MSGDGTAPGGAPTTRLASPPAEEYLDGVRAALADLPVPEVAEILDDVRAHLADLAAELGGDAGTAALTARLGPPSAYAAELRAAAGYPAAPPQPDGHPRHGRARLAMALLVAGTLLVVFGLLVEGWGGVVLGPLVGVLGLLAVGREGPGVPAVAALPEVRRLRAAQPAPGTAARVVCDFVVSLQPAWWVVRAVAAAALVVAIVSGGEVPAVLLLALVAVPVSVWLGHRTRRDRRWLWGVVPLNALAALVLLWLVSAGLPQTYPGRVAESYPSVLPGLWQDSEREIRDIRPVDAAGTPLTGVYLFDQDGLPIDTSRGDGCAEYDEYGVPATAERGAPYPRGTWEYDPRTGGCRHLPPGPLVVAVPTGPTTVTTAPAPTAPAPPPTPTPPVPPTR